MEIQARITRSDFAAAMGSVGTEHGVRDRHDAQKSRPAGTGARRGGRC